MKNNSIFDAPRNTNYSLMKRTLLCAFMLLCAYSNSFAFLSQGNWRWRNNNGSEKTATWKAMQDSGIIINDNKAIRIRIDMFNAQSTTKGIGSTLEYATTLNGQWMTVSSAAAENAFILAGDNGYITNDAPTTAQLTETGSYTFAPGRIFALSSDYSDSLLTSQRKEYEWCIKPTANIAPNTKYYFRAAIGSGQTTNLPYLTTGSGFASPPALISNGSFEQGATVWSHVDNAGGNTFALEDTAVFDGNTALRVSVTNNGAFGSVYIAHAPTHINPSHIYLIRFWAKADVNAAPITLQLQGKSNFNEYFRMYTKWQRYQYAFKPTDTSLIFKFIFNAKANYTFDNVTLVDDTDPVADVPMTYMWQNNRPGYGWLTADGQESIKLPDGRVAWFFSDTWLGINDTTTNFTNTNQLVNNDMVIQTGPPPTGTLTTYFSGTSASPKALIIPPTPKGAQYWYWPRNPVIENNNLKILLPEVERVTTNADPTNAGIGSVATINLSTLQVTNIENLPYKTADQYSTILQTDSSSKYNYIYGGDLTYPQPLCLLARYPKNLSASVPWEFYTGTSWVADETKAAPMAPFTFGNVIELDTNNYAAVFEANLSNALYVMYAPKPWGPWTNKTELYQIPPLADGLTYFGSLHEETGKNGIYTISYSSNTGIPQMLNDKGTYQPHFVKADIGGLSPYSAHKSADSVISFNAQSHGKQVTLQWTVSNKTDINFIVQQSTDGNNWSNVATVAGNGTNSYQAQFNNPPNGLTYYRLELFDEDNVMAISPVKPVQINSNAAVQALTIVPGNNGAVDISFNTTSEFFNDHFTIQRTTDTTNWSMSKQIPGAGTTSAIQYYSFADNPTPEGIYYYRLQFYRNGSLIYSPTIKADTRPSVMLASGYAVKQGTAVLLHLATKSEVNNPGFIVQKSTDGTNWQTFLNVAGSGTTFVPQTYQTTDNNPVNGLNYYRLLYYYQGVQVTSATSVVNMTQGGNAVLLNVYPNPAKTNVSFALTGYSGSSFTATITDLYGKPIGKQTLNVNPNGQYVLNTNMSPGTYILNINGNGLSKASRVMVQ